MSTNGTQRAVLLDPRFESFSIRAAQKAVQLAASCLSRDPKASPRMTEVVEVLKPLLDLKDMACSSSSFKTMEGGSSNHGSRHGETTPSASSSRNVIPTRSTPPSHHNHILRSPKTNVGPQAFPSLPNCPLHSPRPNVGSKAMPSRNKHTRHKTSSSHRSPHLHSPKPDAG